MKPDTCLSRVNDNQQGSVLLEALIAIVIFSVGLVGLIGIQAKAVGMSIDAKYRADAAYLSNQIVSQMWLDRGNIADYAHHPGVAPFPCGEGVLPSGAAAINTNVHDPVNPGRWTSQVEISLPSATEDRQQIVVTKYCDNGPKNPCVAGEVETYQVAVGICWKRPQETTWHKHVTLTQINQ
jgi:type IV pilus assembly protein PilV